MPRLPKSERYPVFFAGYWYKHKIYRDTYMKCTKDSTAGNVTFQIESDTSKYGYKKDYFDSPLLKGNRGGYILGKVKHDDSVDAVRYISNDIDQTIKVFEAIHKHKEESSMPKIKNILSNDPVLTVVWDDGTVTMAKAWDGYEEIPAMENGNRIVDANGKLVMEKLKVAEAEEYNEKIGLLHCILKKEHGSNTATAKWLEETIKHKKAKKKKDLKSEEKSVTIKGVAYKIYDEDTGLVRGTCTINREKEYEVGDTFAGMFTTYEIVNIQGTTMFVKEVD